MFLNHKYKRWVDEGKTRVDPNLIGYVVKRFNLTIE